MRETNTTLRFRTQVKIWLKWRRELRFFKTKSRFSKTNRVTKTEYWLSAKSKSKWRIKKEINLEASWITKNSLTRTKWALSAKKSMREINLTWLLTLCKKKWTTWFSITRWPVSLEITWVFNWLIKTMSCVFFTRRAISKRISSKMESKK